jgi:hypothetical protein
MSTTPAAATQAPGLDQSAPDPCPALAQPKALDTLRARCALAGIALHITTDDRGRPLYIVSKWALTRSISGIEELAAWVDRVTGTTA